MKNEKIIKKISKIVKRAIIKDVFADVSTEKCVIDIFLQDQKEFAKIIDNINQVSLFFLIECGQKLKEEFDEGKILFFRKYNYEKILNDHLCRVYGIDILEINLSYENEENKDISEQEILMYENYRQGEILKYRTECSQIPTEKSIQIKKNDFKKIKKRIDKKQKDIELDTERTRIRQTLLSNINNITWTKYIKTGYYLYRGIFDDKTVEFRVAETVKNKNHLPSYSLKYDNKMLCYTKYDGDSIKKLIEQTHPKVKKKEVIVVFNDTTSKRKKNNLDPEIEQKRIEEIAKRNAELEQQRKLKEERKRLHEERMRAQQEEKRLKELERKKRAELKEKEQQEMLRQLPQIGIKDFVVRRAVFKCMHSKHDVVDLTAAVGVIDNDGREKLVKISAGYCKMCNIYFVMESTYEKLRNMGVVLCRVCDEKSYMKNSYVNGIKLAQESILMQFGYTVSQTEGLSATRRQKILAVIIDKHILSKSEIISYLDFFISQRQYQSKFELAVSKWETDREFVEEYKIGEYTQFGVNAIYRR